MGISFDKSGTDSDPILLFLNNFRGFSDALIPIKKVNFLVGENSTGKSSLLEIVQCFSQPPFWLFDADLQGALAEKHFGDLVSVSATDRTFFEMGVAFVITTKGRSSINARILTYRNSEGRARLSRMTIARGDKLVSIHVSYAGGRKVQQRTGLLSGKQVMDLAQFSREVLDFHRQELNSNDVDNPLIGKGAPLLMALSEMMAKTLGYRNGGEMELPDMFGPGLVWLAPIRSRPFRTYDKSQTRFSPEGDHVPYVIRKRLENKERAAEFKKFLSEVGESSGLFKEVKVKPYGKSATSPFELDVVLSRKPISIDNVGYGVSQALPVFVEMFTRPRGTTYAVQQPEVHLHPRAQAAFGQFVSHLAANENKSFFIETHSDFAIDRFRTQVRDKQLKLSSQILFFDRDSKGNTATSISIGNDGSLDKKLPKRYREFFLREQLNLLGL